MLYEVITYLNVIEWGEGVFGAEAAARHYFGLSARNLSASQAAYLAAMVTRPRYYEQHRRITSYNVCYTKLLRDNARKCPCTTPKNVVLQLPNSAGGA